MDTLGKGLQALAKFALQAAADDDVESTIPDGLHLLGNPERDDVAGDPDFPTWTIRCSCGWYDVDGAARAGSAELAGMMHVAKWVDELSGTS